MNSGIALAWHTQKWEEDTNPHLSACVYHTVRVFHISQVHTQKSVSLPGHGCCWQAAASSCWPRGWRLQQRGAEPASAYGKGQLPVGDICFISQTFELGSPSTLETSLCDACQFIGWKSWQETYFKEGGNIPVVAELLRLSWFITMSFSLSHEFFLCMCLYAGIVPTWKVSFKSV